MKWCYLVLLADAYNGGILNGNVQYPRQLHIHIKDYLQYYFRKDAGVMNCNLISAAHDVFVLFFYHRRKKMEGLLQWIEVYF